MEKIFIEAGDGKTISALYFKTDKPKGWLVLVHMMPSTKESWVNFAQTLQNEGFESIAMDLRGHGESEGGPEGYQSFSDSDHQKSILDLDAGVRYLLDKGATPDKIIFIGASIGANLSLQYTVEHPDVKTAVLLSPGINYRGIESEPLAKKLKTDQKIFLIGARDDNRSAGNMEDQIRAIEKSLPQDVLREKKIYDTGGHGTDILKNHPDLVELIIKFIKINE